MAKITLEQIKKANSKMENGFVLDHKYYCIWGEKVAHKYIPLDNEANEYIECRIEFFDVRKNAWDKEKNFNLEYTTTHWKRTSSGCYASGGYNSRTIISTGYTKKLFSEIQKATSSISDDNILSMNNSKNIGAVI